MAHEILLGSQSGSYFLEILTLKKKKNVACKISLKWKYSVYDKLIKNDILYVPTKSQLLIDQILSDKRWRNVRIKREIYGTVMNLVQARKLEEKKNIEDVLRCTMHCNYNNIKFL